MKLKQTKKTILTETSKFYKNLYGKRNPQTSIYNFFDDNIQKLNDTEKRNCEGKITENECLKALKEMKNNKGPGSDGLTVEFYKMFWNTIKQYYVNSINYSYENGHLTELQKQGIITLIPKPNKEKTLLENWRPKSLLNTDYKIAWLSLPGDCRVTDEALLAETT